MSDVLDIGDLSIVVRRTAARIGKAILVAPDIAIITDTSGSLNSFAVLSTPLPVPTAAPTLAATDVGTGLITFTNYPQSIAYYVTFWDNNNSTESNPVYCGTVSITSASNVNLDLTQITNEAANARITHCKIYRNLLGTGTTFFPVATVAVGSMGATYKDNVPNATAAASFPTLALDNHGPSTGAAPGTSTYGIVSALNGYGILAGPYNALGGTAYDDSYILCKLNNPDAWPAISQNYVARGRCGIIRAVHTQGDAWIIYKDTCTARLAFVRNPLIFGGDGSLKVTQESRGTVNQKTVVNIDGVHYVLDQLGIYVHSNGHEMNEIGQELTEFIRRINWKPVVSQWFHATYTNEAVYFFVALDGDTVPHHVFVLNLTAIRAGRGVRWSIHRYHHGIMSSTRYWTGGGTAAVAHQVAGQWRAAIVTDNGYLFWLGAGYRDGLHPYLIAEGTVKASPTPTTTQCALNESGDISYTNATSSLTSTLVGCHVMFPDNATRLTDALESSEITAQSAGPPILLTYSALARAPIAGERVWIGAIPQAIYRTPQMDFGDPEAVKKCATVLRFEQRSVSHDVGVGFIKDNNEAPSIRQTVSSGTDQNGIETVSGSPYVLAKMGGSIIQQGRHGFIRIEADRERFHTVAVELDASGVDKPTLIDRIAMEPERAD